jgi:hypothetical protein
MVLEEDCHAKRPPLLREPFVIYGLEAGGPLQRVLRELALPLIEQRKLVPEAVALQVLLPDARVDVRAGRRQLAEELAAFGLADAPLAERWLELVDEAGSAGLARLLEEAQSQSASIVRRMLERAAHESALVCGLPSEPPQRCGPLVRALLAVLGHRAEPGALEAPALLLHSLREGASFMPGAGEPFVDLLRKRVLALHGEIRAISEFQIGNERGEVVLETARGRITSRALVIAAPRELVARAIETHGGTAPRWLRGAPPPVELPVRLFRAERDQLPVGLGRRAIVADAQGHVAHWLARHSDPHDSRIDWLVAAGPDAGSLASDNPLGSLNPFPGDGLVAVDPGPKPAWDRDGSDLRFVAPRLPGQLRSRVIAVGAEIEPGLGLLGEVLRAREAALRLTERLGARRKLA